MYSVILPTMWKSTRIKSLIDNLIQTEEIGEIILIDNNQSVADDTSTRRDKIKYLPQTNNIYVNPSWNLGVSESKFDKIIIINDDINLSFDFLKVVEIDSEEIIGIEHTCYKTDSNHFTIDNSEKREWGWGCLLIFNKKDWVEIPNELKIWCGDDFIFDNFKIKKQIKGLPIKTEMSTTSELKEFDQVKDNDLKIYTEKYARK